MGGGESVGGDFELIVPCLRDWESELAEFAGDGFDGFEIGGSAGDVGVGDATAGRVMDNA